jgi:hypothetical protein
VIRETKGASVQILSYRTGNSFGFIGDLSGKLAIGAQCLHADVRLEMDMTDKMVFAPMWLFGAFAPR